MSQDTLLDKNYQSFIKRIHSIEIEQQREEKKHKNQKSNIFSPSNQNSYTNQFSLSHELNKSNNHNKQHQKNSQYHEILHDKINDNLKLNQYNNKQDNDNDNNGISISGQDLNSSQQLYDGNDDLDNLVKDIDLNQTSQLVRQSIYNNFDQHEDKQLSERINKYDPFRQPPDWELVDLHRQARRVGLKKPHSVNICPCCNSVADKELIPLNCIEKDLAFLGSGYSLFFRLTKYFSLIIVILLIIGGSFTYLITNFYCEEETSKCVKFLFIPVLDLNHLEEQISKQTYQNVFVGLVIMVIIIYMKPFIFEDIFEYNDNFISPIHYTICIKNLPRNTQTDEIKTYFEELTKEKIVKINFAYDISDYTESFNNKLENLKKLKEYQFRVNKLDFSTEDGIIEKNRIEQNTLALKNQLKVIEDRLQEFQREIKKPSSSKFLGTVFISFQHQMPVRCILDVWGVTALRQFQFFFFSWFKSPYMKYKNRTMIIEQPGAPTDIIWENVEFQQLSVLINNLIMVFGSLGLLTISFSIQFWIMKYVYPYKKESIEASDFIVKINAILLSLVVVIINVLLRLLVFQFTKLMKFDSVTKLYSAYINRYIFLYFANSAFIPYIVHGIFDAKDDTRALLIQDIHFILLGSSFSTPLSKIFEIDIILKIFQRRKLNAYKADENPYTQYEAHQISEDYIIDIADSYAFISRTLFLSAWYATVAPVGILFGLAGLFLNYWIDKYQLLRIQSQPQSINEKVIKSIINSLELVPIIYILGALQYSSRITRSENVLEFVFNFLSYGISNIFLTIAFVAFFLFGRQKMPKGKLDKFPYEKVRIQFYTEYDACNPITKYEANKDWIKYLYSQKIINEQEKKKLLLQGKSDLQSNQVQVPNLTKQGTVIFNNPLNLTPRLNPNENKQQSFQQSYHNSVYIPQGVLSEGNLIEMVDLSVKSEPKESTLNNAANLIDNPYIKHENTNENPNANFFSQQNSPSLTDSNDEQIINQTDYDYSKIDMENILNKQQFNSKKQSENNSKKN